MAADPVLCECCSEPIEEDADTYECNKPGCTDRICERCHNEDGGFCYKHFLETF